MRKPSRREVLLLGLVAVAALVLAIRLLRGTGNAPVAAQTASTTTALLPIPKIDLARLDRPRDATQASRRDIFGFGRLADPEETDAPIMVRTPPPAIVAMPAASDSPGAAIAPALPPLALNYIGSVETAGGVKVAVLVTDRKEVLTGQAGDVLANRYRVARIGIESVDLEDVSTGQSRRLGLRAN